MEAPKTTFVGTAFYEDKEAADRAFKKRNKQIAQEGFSNNFSHKGKVIAFCAEIEQPWN